MTATPWTQSAACLSRHHCRACRDPRRAGWRRSLARIYRLPDNDANFPCPYGVSWSGTAPAPSPVSEPSTPPTRPQISDPHTADCTNCRGL